MKRRDLDGCPITGALQMLGDRWTMLIVRELSTGPKRTMELLNSLYPISSRTLVGRLRDMEKDQLLARTDYGGNPPHIEYELTSRGVLLLPLLDTLRQLGLILGCSGCAERLNRLGAYCESCHLKDQSASSPRLQKDIPARQRDHDESIVLL